MQLFIKKLIFGKLSSFLPTLHLIQKNMELEHGTGFGFSLIMKVQSLFIMQEGTSVGKYNIYILDKMSISLPLAQAVMANEQ